MLIKADLPVLDRRALNRATLARQHLLDRGDLGALDAIRWLVGIQAQEPPSPYVTLWSRLKNFDPSELGRLLTDRAVVRMALMRNTIHLTMTDDALCLRPLMQVVADRQFRSTSFAKDTAALDLDLVAQQGRLLLEAAPRTNAQVGALLAERWPGVPKGSLAQVLRHRLALVQVPPRGVWGARGAATLTTLESWSGRSMDKDPSMAEALLRFIAAYGPASGKDIQQWCGLTKLKAVIDELSDRLVKYQDIDGTVLYDLPEAPRPDADTPAPPRFLADYDNMLISLADRSRFASSTEHRPFEIGFGLSGSLLLDGVVGGMWKVEDTVLEVRTVTSQRGSGLSELRDEAAVFAGFLATGHDVTDYRISRLGGR
jgi:hypothetical protein